MNVFWILLRQLGHLTCDTILRTNRNEVNGFIEGRHNYAFTTCQMV